MRESRFPFLRGVAGSCTAGAFSGLRGLIDGNFFRALGPVHKALDRRHVPAGFSLCGRRDGYPSAASSFLFCGCNYTQQLRQGMGRDSSHLPDGIVNRRVIQPKYSNYPVLRRLSMAILMGWPISDRTMQEKSSETFGGTNRIAVSANEPSTDRQNGSHD